jgi:hypothetical protein
MLFSMLLAPGVQAQTFSFHLRADIPFEFSVGNDTLPAGAYRVTMLNNYTMSVSAVDPGGRQAAVITYPAGGGAVREDSQLIFNRYGNSYFLKKVWREGMAVGQEVPKSKQEDAALFRAAGPATPVVVAARTGR